MNMILFEGRKEDSYKKYQKSIDAERKMISTYMDDASAYDFLIDEPFMKEINYKYLNDVLELHYKSNEYSVNSEPLERDNARATLFALRSQIEKIINFLKIYEKHKSKFKYPEFRQYLTNIQDFFSEAQKIKTEVESKETEKSAKKEVDRLFENDALLIIKPKSFTASCYYGSGTRWCTTMKDNPSYFNQYTSNGNLYYLILKNVDRSNKFYKMAIHAPKNKKFDEDSIWYDSTDERLTSREKESVLAHMPKDAYNAIVNDYKSSNPEEKPLDVIYKIIPNVNQNVDDYVYKFKGGEIELSIDSPVIVDTATDSLIISSDWSVSVQKNGKEVHDEDGVISYTLEPGQNQVQQNYTIRIDFEVFTDSPDWNTEIIKKYSNSLTLGLDNERKNDPEYVRTQVNGAIRTILKDFQNKMEYRLRNDENLLEKYPPLKAQAYTMSKYTFTGKGRLTKAFMEYLKNIPEGKSGSKNEFLTQTGRRSGPGQYSSFFSALAQAGITARQGKSGLVKGVNFDKFYKKVFE